VVEQYYTRITLVSISCLIAWIPCLEGELDESKIWACVYGDPLFKSGEVAVSDEETEEGFKKIYVGPELADNLPTFKVIFNGTKN